MAVKTPHIRSTRYHHYPLSIIYCSHTYTHTPLPNHTSRLIRLMRNYELRADSRRFGKTWANAWLWGWVRKQMSGSPSSLRSVPLPLSVFLSLFLVASVRLWEFGDGGGVEVWNAGTGSVFWLKGQSELYSGQNQLRHAIFLSLSHTHTSITGMDHLDVLPGKPEPWSCSKERERAAFVQFLITVSCSILGQECCYSTHWMKKRVQGESADPPDPPHICITRSAHASWRLWSKLLPSWDRLCNSHQRGLAVLSHFRNVTYFRNVMLFIFITNNL